MRARYEERYQTIKGYEDLDGLAKRLSSSFNDRDNNEHFFRDSVGYWAGLSTRNRLSFDHYSNFEHFREEGSNTSDLDWSMDLGFNMDNAAQSRHLGMGYGFGRADGTFRHFISPRLSGKWGHFSARLNGSFLRHKERRQQHVFSMNYDLTKTITVGGRLVFQRNERGNQNRWNWYWSFRRSGETGVETFLIFGHPNGDKFVPRLEGKVLFPL